MAEHRPSRGVPIPSVWGIVVIAAALVAAWLVYSNLGRQSVDSEEVVAGNPLAGSFALESFLRSESDPVPRLLAGLDSQDPAERKLAAYGLGRLGLAAEQALDKLRERLADDNALVRENAAAAIASVSPDKESALKTIAPLLGDPESAVRLGVGMALAQLGEIAVNPLLEMLHSDNPAMRLEAVRVLNYMRGHPIGGTRTEVPLDALHKPLIELLGSDQPAIRLDALRLLQVTRNGTKSDTMRTDLAIVFDDPDPDIRNEAVITAIAWGVASPEQVRRLVRDPARIETGLRAVGTMGDDAAQLLPDVLALLDDQTAFAPPDGRDVRNPPKRLELVLYALSSMKTVALPATERLIEIAARRRDFGNLSIARTLHAIGAADDVVAGPLSPLLLNPDWQAGPSWRAGQLMVEIIPDAARRQVTLLIPKLGSNETTVDKTILYALYALGPQAQEAVPAVVPLLQNRDPWIAEFAGHMLAETGIGSVDVVANLAQAVASGSRSIDQRLTCAGALGKLGLTAQSAVPELLRALEEQEPAAPRLGDPHWGQPNVRAAIIMTLGRIGAGDASLVPVLRSELKSGNQQIRAAAADALGRVAVRSSDVFSELIRRVRDDDAGVRAMAALAIGRLAPDRTPRERETAVGCLTTALGDEYLYVWRAATISLGRLGPSARAALPALRQSAAEQKSPVSDTRAQKPPSLRVYWELSELDGIDNQKIVHDAIAEIDRGPQEEALPQKKSER